MFRNNQFLPRYCLGCISCECLRALALFSKSYMLPRSEACDFTLLPKFLGSLSASYLFLGNRAYLCNIVLTNAWVLVEMSSKFETSFECIEIGLVFLIQIIACDKFDFAILVFSADKGEFSLKFDKIYNE